MHYKSDDFHRARVKLTLLYTLVMSVVLMVFSIFLFIRVEQQHVMLSADSRSGELISKEEALAIVQSLNPQAQVTDIEEESLHDSLVYAVEVHKDEQETDVYVDRITGLVLASINEDEEVETFNDVLINDFEENLLWTNVIALLLTFFLSYFLAGATLRPIQRKMRQQEQFSLDVAHEIRTPLAAILAAADSVSMKEETVEIYQETLSNIKDEARRLNNLTEDLLATARGTQTAEFVMVDMNEVTTDVVNRLTRQADLKDVRLDVVVEQTFFTFGNRTMLERMIENVVHNAIKFSHDGSTVKIVLKDNLIRISDDGIGMSPETKTHIFERLYTADSSRNEYNKNGVGLGLAIVRQIAYLHKITIKIDSEQGRGTVFQFSFLQ